MNENKLYQKLISIANAILEEKIGIIEASRELAGYNYEMKDKNGQLNIFRSIDSDTDHFPMGELRKLWDQQSLVRVDLEIKNYEEDVRDEVREACKKLIKELSSRQK